ncbi:MGMT family protein [Sinomonas flava]|uniref:Methylated-DNA-[protein]-cysteine S-methyltransferase DNA binding domain-containing protein n=1 Tax=Sinomonas flava TaxID=496857 RepID=A0ABP5NF59_9MICC
MREEFVEAVLAVVDLVPPGSVVSYGDVAELLGAGGPRQVGAVMSHHGAAVCWWRVLRASGEAPEHHEAAALERYRAEGTPLRGDPARGTQKVDIQRARWAPTDAELDAVEAIADRLYERLHRHRSASGLAGRGMSDPDSGMDP